METELKPTRIAVDVIARYGDNEKYVVIDRKTEPTGLAMPGVFLKPDETLEQAATRGLKAETGLSIEGLLYYQPFSELYRDPRGHVVTQVYAGDAYGKPKAGKSVNEVLSLTPGEIKKRRDDFAFDHYEILKGYFDQKNQPKSSLMGLPLGMQLWQVRHTWEEYSNGSYGGPEFAGWETETQNYYVLAGSAEDAISKLSSEKPKLKKLKKDEELQANPIPIESLVPAGINKERVAGYTTKELYSVDLSLKGDKKAYKLGVHIVPLKL